MVYVGKPTKFVFYDNSTKKKTMQQVKNETGCDLIINGSLYDMATRVACCDIKIDGKVQANDIYTYWAYCWNNGELPKVDTTAKIDKYDNVLSCIWAIHRGVKQTLNNNAAGVGGRRERSAFGFKKDGSAVFLCVQDKKEKLTLEETRDVLFNQGCYSGIILDGGGSSQMITPYGSIKSSRCVANFICVWFEKETGKDDSKQIVIKDTADLEHKIIEVPLKQNGIYGRRTKTQYLILHHAANSSQSVEEVAAYHLSKGWAGIGYHYYVRKDGSIYRGRPENTVGAHCVNYNTISIGVCAEGNYETTQEMPQAQKDALKWLCADIQRRYPKIIVKRHKDLQATACPGKYYPYDYIISGMKTQKEIKESGATNAVQNPNKNPAFVIKFSIYQMWLNKTYKFKLPLSGAFDAKTKEATIKAMQNCLNQMYGAGLVVDGIWGPKTRAAFRTVKQGDRNNLVYVMQGLLYACGYDAKGIDGIFGAGMKNAVILLQKDRKLEADGIIGKDTLTAMMAGNMYGASDSKL